MGRPRNRPAEFFSDWHWERHHEDLLRALDGANGRLFVAEQMPEGSERDQMIKDANAEIEGTHKQLEYYGWGVRSASKRPKAEKKSTR